MTNVAINPGFTVFIFISKNQGNFVSNIPQSYDQFLKRATFPEVVIRLDANSISYVAEAISVGTDVDCPAGNEFAHSSSNDCQSVPISCANWTVDLNVTCFASVARPRTELFRARFFDNAQSRSLPQGKQRTNRSAQIA